MKAKTIKVVIGKKVDEWLASIEDEVVRKLAEKNTIVTGGCIVSMLLKEKVNDFDIYFRTRETAKAVAQYYIDRFKIKQKKGIECKISIDMRAGDRIKIVIKSAGIASEDGTEKPYQYFESQAEGEAGEYVESIIQDPGDIEDVYEETKEQALETEDEGKPKFRPVFLSTNAITLSQRIQLIFRFYGSPDSIHEYYDYVHCTNYWTSWDKELVLRQAALEAILARELVYIGSRYPICSIFRIRKFIRRGWTINAGQILKIAMQISELDLTSTIVLEDQLTGVDVAYFLEIIEKVKEKDPLKVNQAYLIEILDRMF
jgi:hypothetical protein